MTLRKFKREQDILTIIRWLWMMPLLSLPELAVVTGLTYNRCNRLAKILYRRGMVESVRLGMTLELQDRHFLTTSGVGFAMEQLGYSLEWQVSESGLRLLIRRLPTLEVFYRLVHRLWGLDGVERINPIYRSPDPDEEPIQFPRDLRLTRFQWQRDSNVHAIAEYANEAWVPWVWVGPMTKRTMLDDTMWAGVVTVGMRSFFGEDPCPAGWVVVGADRLAAAHARSVWRSDDTLVITAEGKAWKPMRPVDFGRPCWEDARIQDLGVPESVPDWVEKNPVVRALNGKLNFAVFESIAQWTGQRVRQIQSRFTHSHGAINAGAQNAGWGWCDCKTELGLLSDPTGHAGRGADGPDLAPEHLRFLRRVPQAGRRLPAVSAAP